MIRKARRYARRAIQIATVVAIAGILGGPALMLAGDALHSLTVGAYWLLATGLAGDSLIRHHRRHATSATPPAPRVEAVPEGDSGRYYRIPHPRRTRRRGDPDKAATGGDAGQRRRK